MLIEAAIVYPTAVP